MSASNRPVGVSVKCRRTAAPNDGARRLFERLGFRQTMIEMTREL